MPAIDLIPSADGCRGSGFIGFRGPVWIEDLDFRLDDFCLSARSGRQGVATHGCENCGRALRADMITVPPDPEPGSEPEVLNASLSLSSTP